MNELIYNKQKLKRIFSVLSANFILCYCVSLTLFLSAPPKEMHYNEVFKTGLVLLEYIYASIFSFFISLIMLEILYNHFDK